MEKEDLKSKMEIPINNQKPYIFPIEAVMNQLKAKMSSQEMFLPPIIWLIAAARKSPKTTKTSYLVYFTIFLAFLDLDNIGKRILRSFYLLL